VKIAVFDVDHTITRVSTGRRLIEYGWKSGLFSIWTLVTLPYHYLRYRSGILQIDRVAARISGLAGRTRTELTEVAERCYREAVRDDVMPDAERTIRDHQAKGDRVVLATSSLDLIIGPLAAGLAVDHVIATALEFKGGVATGRFHGPPCFGEEKRRKVEDLVTDLGHTMEDVVFYSDSSLDLPLLEVSGEAIAVNPDPGLRRAASRAGWKIRTFK